MRPIFFILILSMLQSCNGSRELDMLEAKVDQLEIKVYRQEKELRYYKDFTAPVIEGVVNEISHKTGVQYPATLEQWMAMKRIKI